MIINYDFDERKTEFSDEKAKDLKKDLAQLQLECSLKNIPVIVIIEGWESAGKGYIINELTERLDTKHYSVSLFGERGYGDFLFTRSFWNRMPAKGDFAIQDRSSYTYLFNHLTEEEFTDEEMIDKKLSYLLQSEKVMIEDGYLIVKYFLNISKETQRKRIEDLAYDKYKDFLISENDLVQNLYYDKLSKHIDRILEKSNTDLAPWTVVNGENLEEARNFILGHLCEQIEERLEKEEEKELEPLIRNYEPKEIIEKVPGNLKVSDEEYDDNLSHLQKRAGNLSYELFVRDIPVVLVLEGTDAAGKGGAIRRLTRFIDPRGVKVNPTSAPSDFEKDYHYLWRFYNNFPEQGHIHIFDRSWYGRVMVERVEGFARDEEWARAYEEINAMEKEFVESGIILIKYFIVIDKDEQLERFKDREEEKPHKLTDEDWRNREKWDENTLAINEMVDKTSTKYAPWNLIPGNQKKYARLKVLDIFIEEVSRSLGI